MARGFAPCCSGGSGRPAWGNQRKSAGGLRLHRSFWPSDDADSAAGCLGASAPRGKATCLVRRAQGFQAVFFVRAMKGLTLRVAISAGIGQHCCKACWKKRPVMPDFGFGCRRSRPKPAANFTVERCGAASPNQPFAYRAAFTENDKRKCGTFFSRCGGI